jgi:hypothetical protein
MEVLMKNCHKISKWFSEYIDDDLAADKSALFKEHLDNCEYCRARFEGLTHLRQNLKSLTPFKASASFDAVLLNRLRHEKRKAAQHSSWSSLFESSYWRLPAYAAAAMLFLFLGAQMQKFAFLKQLDQSKSIVYTLKNSAGEPTHLIFARIDSAENRIHLTNFGNNNVESAASTPAFYMTEKELRDLRNAGLPDLRKAANYRMSDFNSYPSSRNQPRIINASSQLQF